MNCNWISKATTSILALSWQLNQGTSSSQYGQLPESVALTYRDYF